MSDKAHTSRIAAYKNAAQGVADLRRKRFVELSPTLRVQVLYEQLLKRLAMSPEADETLETEKVMPPNEIVQGLKSSDLSVTLTSAIAARIMLSSNQNPPIDVMLNAGVLKPLIDALDRDDCNELQYEAAWAITNIASGTHDHTMAIIDSGAVPRLIKLLGQGGPVGIQSAWALGNISGDGAQQRDFVLSQGALPALLPLLQVNSPTSQLRTASWTLSNFCRFKNPLVNIEIVAPALPYIADLLEVEDMDVLACTCRALSYLTDGPIDRIEEVQNTPHLLLRLIKLLSYKIAAIKTPVLRAVGNMLTGSDRQTDRCLKGGCLDYIADLLYCGKPSLVREATWALSNVLAGTKNQIQLVIDKGMLSHLIYVLSVENVKCQKEAAWAITNICTGGTPSQLDTLTSAGFIEPYCALLNSLDDQAVLVVLEGLTHLLQAAARFGQVEFFCLKLGEIGALDKLEQLLDHENEQIYKKSLHILDKYFTDSKDSKCSARKDK